TVRCADAVGLRSRGATGVSPGLSYTKHQCHKDAGEYEWNDESLHSPLLAIRVNRIERLSGSQEPGLPQPRPLLACVRPRSLLLLRWGIKRRVSHQASSRRVFTSSL